VKRRPPRGGRRLCVSCTRDAANPRPTLYERPEGSDPVHKGIENSGHPAHIPRMPKPLPLVTTLAAALREARRERRVSIAALAAQAGVSPRLISEFEQGKRPHVSLDTALRLLELMQVPLLVAQALPEIDEDRARRERASWRPRPSLQRLCNGRRALRPSLQTPVTSSP